MDALIKVYQQRLDLLDAQFSRIDHAEGMVADVYKITSQDDSPLILKICPRTSDFLREFYFLTRFAGVIPVPRIVELVQPEKGIHGAVLMQCLNGTPLSPDTLTDKLAYTIGSQLAHIHTSRLQSYGDFAFPEQFVADPRVHFAQKFQEGLEECSDNLPQPMIEQCQKYVTSHLDLLASVDGPCIIHRDFRPGNLIVHNNTLQGIIDWSSGRVSFAEEDFCPWELGEWGTNAAHKAAFLQGYASVRKVPNYKNIMPILCLSRAVATIGFTVKQRTWNTLHSRLYQVNRQFLESSLKHV